MHVLFLIVVAPLFFFLFTWAVATACRLYFVEHPLPVSLDVRKKRQQKAAAGQTVPVGVREIREDQRRHRRERTPVSYHYSGFASGELPDDWIEDLWQRRN